MKKIPTLFRRDPQDMSRVTAEVSPECQWVLDGDGLATRKYDGTCVMLDEDGQWWARREVKPGKQPPAGWVEADRDEVTGKRPGWEPVEQSSFAKFHTEALNHWDSPLAARKPGTYELVGPKINGNPERCPDGHALIRHADAETIRLFDMPDVDSIDIAEAIRILGARGWEGVVWHHPDGRMAKLKARDFPSTATA